LRRLLPARHLRNDRIVATFREPAEAGVRRRLGAPDNRGAIRASIMSRQPLLNSPFLLGFDDIERALDRVTKAAGDGYPPYNIERLCRDGDLPERLRITLAVAGFTREQLEILVEESQLTIRGRQTDERERVFLHRGIAARQFQRSFLLADGMEVLGAELQHGLLAIDLARPEPARIIRRIDIVARDEA
jgi:HSP20 family molecular chaperone IbpA